MSARATPGVAGAALRSLYPIVIGFTLAYLMQTVVAVSIDDYYSKVLIDIGIAIVLGVSLGIVNGYAGQFSLGHAGFMAIGRYTPPPIG